MLVGTSLTVIHVYVSDALIPAELDTIFKAHTFVGIIDLYAGQSMIQHGTKLYLVNHHLLCDELFYQLGLRQFGSLGKLHLKPPPSLMELMEIAVAHEPGVEEANMPQAKIVKVGTHKPFIPKAFMLTVTIYHLLRSCTRPCAIVQRCSKSISRSESIQRPVLYSVYRCFYPAGHPTWTSFRFVSRTLNCGCCLRAKSDFVHSSVEAGH